MHKWMNEWLSKLMKSYLSPILWQVLKPLEGWDEFERDKSLFVPLDMFQQELILANVRVRKVKLHLETEQ